MFSTFLNNCPLDVMLYTISDHPNHVGDVIKEEGTASGGGRTNRVGTRTVTEVLIKKGTVENRKHLKHIKFLNKN